MFLLKIIQILLPKRPKFALNHWGNVIGFLSDHRARAYILMEELWSDLLWITSRTTDAWWLDLKFSTAQIHIPIPNKKKICKIYEHLSFFEKKWLSNAKLRTSYYFPTTWHTKIGPYSSYIFELSKTTLPVSMILSRSKIWEYFMG